MRNTLSNRPRRSVSDWLGVQIEGEQFPFGLALLMCGISLLTFAGLVATYELLF